MKNIFVTVICVLLTIGMFVFTVQTPVNGSGISVAVGNGMNAEITDEKALTALLGSVDGSEDTYKSMTIRETTAASVSVTGESGIYYSMSEEVDLTVAVLGDEAYYYVSVGSLSYTTSMSGTTQKITESWSVEAYVTGSAMTFRINRLTHLSSEDSYSCPDSLLGIWVKYDSASSEMPEDIAFAFRDLGVGKYSMLAGSMDNIEKGNTDEESATGNRDMRFVVNQEGLAEYVASRYLVSLSADKTSGFFYAYLSEPNSPYFDISVRYNEVDTSLNADTDIRFSNIGNTVLSGNQIAEQMSVDTFAGKWEAYFVGVDK